MSASNHYKRFQLTGKISSTQKCDDSLDRPSPPGFVVGFELEQSEKWSVVKVASAMNNLLRRANKVARAEARRAEAQATAA